MCNKVCNKVHSNVLCAALVVQKAVLFRSIGELITSTARQAVAAAAVLLAPFALFGPYAAALFAAAPALTAHHGALSMTDTRVQMLLSNFCLSSHT